MSPEAWRVARVASSRIGCTSHEYIQHVGRGEMWCSFHKCWHPATDFNPARQAESSRLHLSSRLFLYEPKGNCMTNPCTCGFEYNRTEPSCPFCNETNEQWTLVPPKPKPSQTNFDPSSFDDQPDGFKSKPVTSPNRSEEL